MPPSDEPGQYSCDRALPRQSVYAHAPYPELRIRRIIWSRFLSGVGKDNPHDSVYLANSSNNIKNRLVSQF